MARQIIIATLWPCLLAPMLTADDPKPTATELKGEFFLHEPVPLRGPFPTILRTASEDIACHKTPKIRRRDARRRPNREASAACGLGDCRRALGGQQPLPDRVLRDTSAEPQAPSIDVTKRVRSLFS